MSATDTQAHADQAPGAVFEPRIAGPLGENFRDKEMVLLAFIFGSAVRKQMKYGNRLLPLL